MLSKEDNELLTNTEPGTPMGELFRRFWIPVALSEELPGPDCMPVKLKILNEDLIAFRGTDGRVGLVDAYCPHRGAPLFFGRNAEDGLRCVYHGWKFDVDGKCADMPNTPEGDTFREQGQDRQLPLPRGRRHGLRLHGPEGPAAAVPGVRLQPRPAGEHLRHQVPSRVQLAAGHRGRLRPLARRLPALDPGQQRRQPLTALPQPRDHQPHRPAPDQPARTSRWTRTSPTRSRSAPAASRRTTFAPRTSCWTSTAPCSPPRRGRCPTARSRLSLALRFTMPTYCPPGVSRPGHYSANIRMPIDN